MIADFWSSFGDVKSERNFWWWNFVNTNKWWWVKITNKCVTETKCIYWWHKLCYKLLTIFNRLYGIAQFLITTMKFYWWERNVHILIINLFVKILNWYFFLYICSQMMNDFFFNLPKKKFIYCNICKKNPICWFHVFSTF